MTYQLDCGAIPARGRVPLVGFFQLVISGSVDDGGQCGGGEESLCITGTAGRRWQDAVVDLSRRHHLV
jgi:hypothetical protein